MTKSLVSAALGAALVLGMATPALAQQRPAAAAAATGTVVNGIAWANIEAAEAGTNAFKTAESQRPVTYKAQYDQAEARSQALNAQIKPLVDKFNADRAAAAPNQASLQQQAQAIQQIQQGGQAELQRILQPVAYSQAYVAEQIEGKLQQAVDAAMTKRGVTLLLKPESLLQVSGQAYNLTPEVTAQLNTLIPTAQLVPPAGWEPREVREAKAQQAAQAGQAAPAAAAAPAASAKPGQPSRN
ncbi:OmpH family outer membrane protein [Novosphingobium flavum]|uniref:OmpH family outer membrane protein n=1 Tax=Novosphingobium flavum TaxID=1778672 RepID=A0A7X1FQ18_9SPHN|nr:OmpH family outer membrane protein [Novosphingobium flavum]MBC2664865.1 OmpH family outer membrane protein [Novosphingobium flavum]